MSKNSKMDEHTSTKRGTVEILEGKLNFILDKQKFIMNPGTILFMDKNAIHSLKANKKTSFILTLS